MDEEGVTNIQYALDFSAEVSTPGHEGLYAAQWPGDDIVDWLFWNLFFFGDDIGRDFYDMTNTAYSFFEDYSNVPIEYEGETFTCDFASANWGLGPWGHNVNQMDEDARVQFLNDAAYHFQS